MVLGTLALCGLLGTAAFVAASDRGSPSAPAATVAGASTRAIGSADTTERWTEMKSQPTADAPSLHVMSADAAERLALSRRRRCRATRSSVLTPPSGWRCRRRRRCRATPFVSADAAERLALSPAATLSGDPFVSADAAERLALSPAATLSGDPFVSADAAERSADTSGS